LISAFVQGKATLYQGRVFTADEMTGDANVILISKNLADTNTLSVGSVIHFKRDIYKYEMMTAEDGKEASSSISSGTAADMPAVYDPGIVKTLEFEFTVIGIFEPRKTTVIGEDGQPQEVASALENVIYASNSVINDCNNQIAAAEIEVNGSDNGYYYYSTVDPMFVLNSPEDLDAFIAEATPKLPQFYQITDNSAEFETVSAPLANMSWIAGIILYVAIGATLLILSLLITLFLRDRKHEMGIYLSLGERKAKVAGQILIEVMMIAVVAISLSLFTGNIIAKNMSGQMLENQIIEEQQNNGDIYPVKIDVFYPGYYSDSSISSQDLIDSYKVTLDGNTILLFYLCGIGTVMLSTLIPIAYTLRLNPKKILM
jgi:putative ABC transport system permease protein